MVIATPNEVEYGEVFTRPWVVEAILDLVGYTADRDLSKLRLVEPSVGSGAFILPAIERLIASAIEHGASYAELNGAIFGMDLQAHHVETCRAKVVALLTATGASEDEAAALAASWLQKGDFLLDDIEGRIDFVVGNPPYIRTEDLDDDIEAEYRSRWRTMRGRADIYVGFYEKSLGLLGRVDQEVSLLGG